MVDVLLDPVGRVSILEDADGISLFRRFILPEVRHGSDRFAWN